PSHPEGTPVFSVRQTSSRRVGYTSRGLGWLLFECPAGLLRTQGAQVTMGQEMSKDVSAGKIGFRRILVVDDDVDGAETLAILLRGAGHDVQVAHYGPSSWRRRGALLPALGFLVFRMSGSR